MASTLAFLLVRRVLMLVGLGPTPDDKDVEIAVLRHQLAGIGSSCDVDETTLVSPVFRGASILPLWSWSCGWHARTLAGVTWGFAASAPSSG